MPRSVRLALAAVLALVVSSRAGADPRWWWNDVRLTNTPTESITPHLRSPTYVAAGAGGKAMFVVWSEADPIDGNLDVWLTATFDAGCTFCPATRLTHTPEDEISPRIAVLALPTGFWSVAVIFTRPATGETIIAWDSTHLPYGVPLDQLCANIEALGPTIVGNAQYVTFGGIDAGGSWADIAAAGTPAFGHFHAVWAEDTLAGPVIRYVHDLTGMGGANFLTDPVKTLATPGAIVSWVGRPRVAADLTSDPDPVSGNTTADRTGVNVVFVQRRLTGPTDVTEIAGLRSVDSGATFSPDGARADAPPSVLSDVLGAGSLFEAAPALDSAFSGLDTVAPGWVSAGWSAGLPGDAPHLACDARYLPAPAAPNPDWLSPGDVDLGSTTRDGDGAPTVAIQYRQNNAPWWLAWQDVRTGTSEIVSHAGTLDSTQAAALDPTRYPIQPVRPLDTGVADDVQLSSCAVDDATLLCPSTRASGEATSVSLDANEIGVFAVWADTRDGNSEIYFKRVDTRIDAPTPTLVTDCDPDGTAHVDVTFALNTTCPARAEKMLRYFVYWRSNVAGGYDNAAAPIVVVHAAEPGPNVTRRITGLTPGVAWHVIVVPEDEARNVFPSDFDPTRAPATVPSNEKTITTPSPCAIAAPCLWRSDVTSLSPHVPDRLLVYLVPPTADDIHLQGPSYRCPFSTGDLEPDAAALDNRVPLSLYQVNVPGGTLRLAKRARTIRFTY